MTSKLFFLNSDKHPGGMPCECRLEGITLIASGEEEVLFPLGQASLTFGGQDDAQIVLTLGDRVLYLSRAQWEGPLAGLGVRTVSERLQEARRVSRAGFRRWRLTVAGVMTGFLVGLAVLVGATDILIRRAVIATPVAWEVELGQQAGRELSGQLTAFEGQSRAQVEALFAELTSAYANQAFRWHLVLTCSPEENAFALPGGTVVVTTGLLKKASGPDELAGVMAHEIQHVVLRHGLHHIYGKLRWRLPLLMLGEQYSTRAVLLKQVTGLANLSYGREMEMEADSRGFDLLVAARVNPQGLESFFQRLADQEGISRSLLNFRSTHPASLDRQRNLAGKLAALGPREWRKPTLDWEKLQKELP